MKKINFFTLLFVLVIMFNSCTDTELNEPVVSDHYYKLVGGYNNDYISAVRMNSDNGLILCGFTQSDLNTTTAYITQTLPSGMVDWDTTYTTNLNSKAHDVIAIPEQNQLLTACSMHYSNDSTYLYLLRYTLNGVLQDSLGIKIFASEVEHIELVHQNDGKILLVTQIVRKNEITKVTTGFLITYQLTNLTLEKQEPEIKLNQRIAGQIVVAYYTEQKMYIAATTYETEKTENNAPPTGIRLFFVDNNAVEWDILYGEYGVYETCSDLIIKGNNLVVAGNYRNSATTQQKIYLSNISLEGKEISDFQIGIDNFNGDISCNSFTPNDSNNYVFTGDISTGTGKKDILFLETTTEGKNILYKSYGSGGVTVGKNTGKFISYIPSSNDYLLAGEMETINNFDICLFKVNEKGEWITRE